LTPREGETPSSS